MATVDILVPTYRGLAKEAQPPLYAMMRESNCYCGGHEPWRCPRGKHSIRLCPPLSDSSVVHWARNQIIAMGMYGPQPSDGRPPADYFFLMDDDMICDPHYLNRLLAYKLDVAVGICTIRRDPPVPNIRFWNTETERFDIPREWDWDAQRLIEIDGAGAAFMVVKRTVLERMGTAYLNCHFELSEDLRKTMTSHRELMAYWEQKARLRKERFAEAQENKDWGKMDCWWFQFLANIVDSQCGELGEDVSFCWKAKKLGFKIYADPQVLPGHLGAYSYSIRDYRERIEQEKAAGNAPVLKENRVALSVGV